MKETETVWELAPHTKAKHKILENYLKPWFPIMGRYNRRILYIDGFAGPGEYSQGEIGSPIIAINIAKNHIIELRTNINFIFIEKDEKRCNHLSSILKQIDLPENFQCQVIYDSFTNQMDKIFNLLDEQEKCIAPSFFLIDPFGYSHTPLDIIKRIMKNKKCEILFTFVYDSISRFINIENNAAYFDELFGTPEWKNEKEIQDPQQKKVFLTNLYINQLHNEAKIRYVRSFEMFNKHNHTVYYLIFGTNHIRGLEVMKDAMWKVDETGEYNFSDRTDPHQTVLFKMEPDYSILTEQIITRFKGHTISISNLEEFVIEKTAFLKKHIRKNILQPMEKATPPEIIVHNRRRDFTYPRMCSITFK